MSQGLTNTVDGLCQLAYIFPGQGSQSVGMGKDLYEAFPSAKRAFDVADDVVGFSLSRLCFQGSEEELRQTINAQPAILTMSYACLQAAREAGCVPPDVRPAFVAGHSLGEYTALLAADMLDFADAVHLVHQRGRLMQEAGVKSPGGMVAVIGLDRAAVEEVCRTVNVEIANINSPGQIVISGLKEAVQRAVELVRHKGAKQGIVLNVSGAFHSVAMQSAAQELKALIEATPFREPRVPVVSNVTAQPILRAEEAKALLVKQLYSPVHWQQSVEYMISWGVSLFLELGPGKVLSGLIKRINGEVAVMNISDVDSLQKVCLRGR